MTGAENNFSVEIGDIGLGMTHRRIWIVDRFMFTDQQQSWCVDLCKLVTRHRTYEAQQCADGDPPITQRRAYAVEAASAAMS